MSMQTSVEVEVDPKEAFTAFTEEMDRWWGNGPIDAWDFSRSVGRRIEPGVGGRVLELYDDGDLELARITVWEPGERVAWKSSVDDVTIDVRFEPTAAGTLVHVEGSVPEGGTGAAGFAVVRMTGQWLPRYFARGRRSWTPLDRLALLVRSRTPAATARWLRDAFGFEPTTDLPDIEPDGMSWIELRLGGTAAILERADDDTGTGTFQPMLFVDDLDAHLTQAEKAGATIVRPIVKHGFASYEAEDCDARRWTFAQAPPRR